MKSTRGTAGRIFSALAHAHINVKMIDQGSSELNIIVGVRHDEFKHAIRALYDTFCSDPDLNTNVRADLFKNQPQNRQHIKGQNQNEYFNFFLKPKSEVAIYL